VLLLSNFLHVDVCTHSVWENALKISYICVVLACVLSSNVILVIYKTFLCSCDFICVCVCVCVCGTAGMSYGIVNVVC